MEGELQTLDNQRNNVVHWTTVMTYYPDGPLISLSPPNYWDFDSNTPAASIFYSGNITTQWSSFGSQVFPAGSIELVILYELVYLPFSQGDGPSCCTCASRTHASAMISTNLSFVE
jgi:hypothetical protein